MNRKHTLLCRGWKPRALALVMLTILADSTAAEVRYTLTDIGIPGRTGSQALGINNKGEVVGGSGGHAFLYSAGVTTDLGTLGGPASCAMAINDAGQVVGYSDIYPNNNPWVQHAFLYTGGSMYDIDGDIHRQTGAYGINNLGQVVGSTNPQGGAQEAFLYSSGQLLNFA